jgi:hypothetical protein
MKVLHFLLPFVFCLIAFTPLVAQQCSDYSCLIKKVGKALIDKKYKVAFDNLEAADGHPNKDFAQIAKLRKQLFDAIEKEKEDAIKARDESKEQSDRAENAINEAKKSEKEAISSKLAANVREMLSLEFETAIRLADYATKVNNPPTEEAVRSLHDVVSQEGYAQVKTINASKRFFNGNVNQCFFSSDGELFATVVPEDSVIRIWKLINGQNISVSRNLDLPTNKIVFSKDNKQIIFQENNGKVKVINTKDGSNSLTFSDSSHLLLTAPSTTNTHNDNILFFRGKPILININNADLTINLVDLYTKRTINTFRENTQLRSCIVSPNEKLIAILGIDNSVTAWDIDKNIRVGKVINESEVSKIVFSPDNNIIAIVKNRTIDLWDISANKLLKSLNGLKSRIDYVAFSNEGKYLLSSQENNQETKLWNIEWGQIVQTIKMIPSLPKSIVFTDRSRFIVSYSANLIIVWRSIEDMLDPQKNPIFNEEQRKGFGIPSWIKD